MANSFGGNQQEGVRTRQPDHPSEGGTPASKSGKKFKVKYYYKSDNLINNLKGRYNNKMQSDN